MCSHEWKTERFEDGIEIKVEGCEKCPATRKLRDWVTLNPEVVEVSEPQTSLGSFGG